MATAQLDSLLRHIHNLAASPRIARETDRQLLDDFAARRDDTAFTALVARHGPMVLRVCRRVLCHEQDAEDAFQATFLVLARNTASIRRREALGGWLHGVAYRTAMKAKRSAARRRNHEARLRDRRPDLKSVPPTWLEVRAALDEEIQRLPAHHRSAFVACTLGGKTVPEAAAELACKVGTVSSWLARARSRLRQRLARRGIGLTAVLAAVSVAESTGLGAVPPLLAKLTIRFGLSVAAGEPGAAVIPAHVVALAAGVTRAMLLTKANVAVAVMVVASLVAVSAALARQSLAAPEQDLAAQETAKPQPATLKPQATDSIQVDGRVVDPDGKSVSGAKLLFIYASAEKVPEKVWATSAADGRFHFPVAKSIEQAPWSGDVWDYSFVVAVAEGHGFAWARVKPDSARDVTLRLVKDDVPIQGRILDLQGKPVAGVTVRIDNRFLVPTKGDLTSWLESLKASKQKPRSREAHDFASLLSPAFGTLFPPVTTGEDGRFELRGIGRERVVGLHVQGPTIATQKIKVMTRTADMFRREAKDEGGGAAVTYYGAVFDLVTTPTKPVVGVVRDKDTGKPLAGVTVRSASIAGMPDLNGIVKTTTDAEGRYRLAGLPKGAGNAIAAETVSHYPGAEERPYVSAIRKVGDTPGLEPVPVDISLKRGVWVEGRVIDKGTGKGLRAGIEYFCFLDNPNAAEVPRTHGVPSHFSRKDGSFRLVGVSGPGIIAVRGNEDKYRMAVGADQIKGKRTDGVYFSTQPYLLYAGNFHTLVEIAPKPEDQSITCNLILDPGLSLKGTILDPDGKPLAGARISGLKSMEYWENKALDKAEFTLASCSPDEPRLVQVIHEEKKLAGSLVVRGDEKGPLQIRLVSWGALTGRLLRPDGEPMNDVTIHPGGKPKELTAGSFTNTIRPDKDGKFRIEGLAPGLKYDVTVIKEPGYSLEITGTNVTDITIKPGETKDLGDIQVKPME